MKSPVILVTGFGGFPGAPRNPTALLMRTLARQEARLARLGVKLERRVLPVIYDEIAPRLKSLVAELSPDLILHFGLAGRRRAISVETRALNYLGGLHPDATGRRSQNRQVLSGAVFARSALVPTRRFDAAVRRVRVPSTLSIDAGDYVCNQTFYLSLAMAQGTARSVGFIHVPRLKASTLARAAVAVIFASLPGLRR